MENQTTQMDIDDCLIENARKVAAQVQGAPYLGPHDWSKMVADLVRIIDQLKKDKAELREAVLRNAETDK